MNTWLNGAWGTCSFELRRSFTFQRTAVSTVLALFPPVMLGLLIFGSQVAQQNVNEPDVQQAMTNIQSTSTLLTVLLISLVCLLSLLLWATPNVQSELEGKSWSFVASRPGGRMSVFLGKFLASFLVSYAISLISISLCVWISNRMLGSGNPQRLWLSLSGIYLLGSLVYAAVFSMFGTLFVKRSMVVSAGYLIGSDFVLASIPGALINKLTIRYHLQEIGISWMGWFLPPFMPEQDYRSVYGEAWPTVWHVLIVLGVTAAMLAIGGWIIVNREYITTDES
jgi:ABC-type transport system involved in multi-copper enzyme maturation permease subunit